MKELLSLYLIFFRMGAVTFGGGYAMLPILQREIVQKRQWMDSETIIDYYGLSQGLPGIIAVNVSCFIGYQRKRIAGVISAALGLVSPCIIIISIIAFFLSNFGENVYVQRALSAISVCVTALILDAVISMWKKGVKDKLGWVIFGVIFLLSMFTEISPVVLVIGCGVVGVIAGRLRKGKGEAK